MSATSAAHPMAGAGRVPAGPGAGADRRPTPEDAAAIGVDLWDVTAHLEASGFSDRAARAAGHASTAGWAQQLLGERDPAPRGRTRRGRRSARSHLLWAALGRAVVMLAGVVICVSTMPRESVEVVVFVIAAAGWLTAQVVSAALWHGLGRGPRGDAVRGAMITCGIMVLLGIATWIALREPTVMIWVLWACSAPLLVTLRPGPLLVALVGIAGALSALAWTFGAYWQVLVLAVGATALASVAAASAAGEAIRTARSRIVPGTVGAVTVALIQTLAHLGLLLVIFLRIGPGAFAAVAIAGLVAGVLADPLFAVARIFGRWVSSHLTRWFPGRTLAGAIGTPLLLALCAAAVWVAFRVLDDPYRVYLDEPLAITAATATAALVATINALLRTGAATGAMVFTVLACTAGGLALTYRLPAEEPWQSGNFILVTAVLVASAAIIVTHRLSRPQAW